MFDLKHNKPLGTNPFDDPACKIIRRLPLPVGTLRPPVPSSSSQHLDVVKDVHIHDCRGRPFVQFVLKSDFLAISVYSLNNVVL